MSTQRLCAWVVLMSFVAALSACDQTSAPAKPAKPATPPTKADAGKPDATPPVKADTPDPPGGIAADNDPEALEWPAPADRADIGLDFKVTNHDDQAMSLADFKGRPIALTWVFTRCANPDMCPLIAVKMADLQRRAKEAGLADKTRFLLLTYDPGYDSPKRLKEFGARKGIDFTNAAMLRPDEKEFAFMVQSFQLAIGPASGGGDQINHKSELFLFDHEGLLARSYSGEWEIKMALDDLKRLVSEQADEAKP